MKRASASIVVLALLASSPTFANECVDAALYDTVSGYADETHHGPDHVNRWLSVLAAFGDDNGHEPMTVGEAQANHDRWTKSRWAPVLWAIRCVNGDCVPQAVRDDVDEYVAETHHGDEHVLRWNRALAAFGVNNGHDAMTSAEATAFCEDRSMSRWCPMVRPLQCIETQAAVVETPDPEPQQGGTDDLPTIQFGSEGCGRPEPATDLSRYHLRCHVASDQNIGQRFTLRFEVTDPAADPTTFTVEGDLIDFRTDPESWPPVISRVKQDGIYKAPRTLSFKLLPDGPYNDVHFGSKFSETGARFLIGANSTDSVVVEDGDPKPIVSISAPIKGVDEGKAFVLELSSTTDQSVDVSVAFDQEGDFAAGSLETQTVTVESGEGVITIRTDDDDEDEDDGRITGTIQAGIGYGVGSADSASVVVSDNDEADDLPVLQFNEAGCAKDGGEYTYGSREPVWCYIETDREQGRVIFRSKVIDPDGVVHRSSEEPIRLSALGAGSGGTFRYQSPVVTKFKDGVHDLSGEASIQILPDDQNPPTYKVGANDTASFTVVDGDPPPTLSIKFWDGTGNLSGVFSNGVTTFPNYVDTREFVEGDNIGNNSNNIWYRVFSTPRSYPITGFKVRIDESGGNLVSDGTRIITVGITGTNEASGSLNVGRRTDPDSNKDSVVTVTPFDATGNDGDLFTYEGASVTILDPETVRRRALPTLDWRVANGTLLCSGNTGTLWERNDRNGSDFPCQVEAFDADGNRWDPTNNPAHPSMIGMTLNYEIVDPHRDLGAQSDTVDASLPVTSAAGNIIFLYLDSLINNHIDEPDRDVTIRLLPGDEYNLKNGSVEFSTRILDEDAESLTIGFVEGQEIGRDDGDNPILRYCKDATESSTEINIGTPVCSFETNLAASGIVIHYEIEETHPTTVWYDEEDRSGSFELGSATTYSVEFPATRAHKKASTRCREAGRPDTECDAIKVKNLAVDNLMADLPSDVTIRLLPSPHKLYELGPVTEQTLRYNDTQTHQNPAVQVNKHPHDCDKPAGERSACNSVGVELWLNEGSHVIEAAILVPPRTFGTNITLSVIQSGASYIDPALLPYERTLFAPASDEELVLTHHVLTVADRSSDAIGFIRIVARDENSKEASATPGHIWFRNVPVGDLRPEGLPDHVSDWNAKECFENKRFVGNGEKCGSGDANSILIEPEPSGHTDRDGNPMHGEDELYFYLFPHPAIDGETTGVKATWTGMLAGEATFDVSSEGKKWQLPPGHGAQWDADIAVEFETLGGVRRINEADREFTLAVGDMDPVNWEFVTNTLGEPDEGTFTKIFKLAIVKPSTAADGPYNVHADQRGGMVLDLNIEGCQLVGDGEDNWPRTVGIAADRLPAGHQHSVPVGSDIPCWVGDVTSGGGSVTRVPGRLDAFEIERIGSANHDAVTVSMAVGHDDDADDEIITWDPKFEVNALDDGNYLGTRHSVSGERAGHIGVPLQFVAFDDDKVDKTAAGPDGPVYVEFTLKSYQVVEQNPPAQPVVRAHQLLDSQATYNGWSAAKKARTMFTWPCNPTNIDSVVDTNDGDADDRDECRYFDRGLGEAGSIVDTQSMWIRTGAAGDTAVRGASCTSGVDYQVAEESSLIIPAGIDTAKFDIRTCDDGLSEYPWEAFTIGILENRLPEGFALGSGPTSATVTILDRDVTDIRAAELMELETACTNNDGTKDYRTTEKSHDGKTFNCVPLIKYELLTGEVNESDLTTGSDSAMLSIRLTSNRQVTFNQGSRDQNNGMGLAPIFVFHHERGDRFVGVNTVITEVFTLSPDIPRTAQIAVRLNRSQGDDTKNNASDYPDGQVRVEIVNTFRSRVDNPDKKLTFWIRDEQPTPVSMGTNDAFNNAVTPVDETNPAKAELFFAVSINDKARNLQTWETADMPIGVTDDADGSAVPLDEYEIKPHSGHGNNVGVRLTEDGYVAKWTGLGGTTDTIDCKFRGNTELNGEMCLVLVNRFQQDRTVTVTLDASNPTFGQTRNFAYEVATPGDGKFTGFLRKTTEPPKPVVELGCPHDQGKCEGHGLRRVLVTPVDPTTVREPAARAGTSDGRHQTFVDSAFNIEMEQPAASRAISTFRALESRFCVDASNTTASYGFDVRLLEGSDGGNAGVGGLAMDHTGGCTRWFGHRGFFPKYHLRVHGDKATEPDETFRFRFEIRDNPDPHTRKWTEVDKLNEHGEVVYNKHDHDNDPATPDVPDLTDPVKITVPLRDGPDGNSSGAPLCTDSFGDEVACLDWRGNSGYVTWTIKDVAATSFNPGAGLEAKSAAGDPARREAAESGPEATTSASGDAAENAPASFLDGPPPQGGCVSDALYRTVTGYAREDYGQEDADRWIRVLATFGDDNGRTSMAAAEARDMAGRFTAGRWRPVAEAIECLDAPAGSGRAPLFPAARNPVREGVVRIVNAAGEPGTVRILATDDAGWSPEPVGLDIGPGESVQLTSDDLERGNAAKGLKGSTGPPGMGDWRLAVSGARDIRVVAYVRTPDGVLTPMHEVAEAAEGAHRVPIFHPASDWERASMLRLVNRGTRALEVLVTGIDDAGESPGGAVSLDIPARRAVLLTAADLEDGGAGLVGALGNGRGKWRLRVAADGDLAVMNLLESPDGHLANLSRATATALPAREVLAVPAFPSASEMSGRRGFVRIVNGSAQDGSVTIRPHDAAGRRYEPLTLALGAGHAADLDAWDLELGNASAGLTGSSGPGTGDWRLEISSELDIEVLAYVVTPTGWVERTARPLPTPP